MATLSRSKHVRDNSVVYCLTHTCIHDDTLDPYGEGYQTCFDGMYGEHTKAMVHRTVFIGYRKGDYEEEE